MVIESLRLVQWTPLIDPLRRAILVYVSIRSAPSSKLDARCKARRAVVASAGEFLHCIDGTGLVIHNALLDVGFLATGFTRIDPLSSPGADPGSGDRYVETR